jgi:hypothetical protein
MMQLEADFDGRGSVLKKVVAGFHTGDRSVGMETDAHQLNDPSLN